MCHTSDSQPPAPPRRGAVAETADLHLTSADGTRLMAHLARPARPAGRAAVVLPDMRGLHGFYRAFAHRLAETGLTALAIDYYGRDLPDGPREQAPETMMPLATALPADQVAADARAAADRLHGDNDTVFAVGFCLGGSHAWNQSAFDERMAGCAGFYGHPDDCRPYVKQMRSPLLLLGAGEDMLTPTADFHAFDAELTEAGVRHTAVLYDGAPHAFFDVMADAYTDACADAWQRLLAFTAQPSGATAHGGSAS